MRQAMLLLSVALVLLPSLCAQLPTATTNSGEDGASIRAALSAQEDAWNRGDIPAFMQTYENSPDTTFIGLTVRKGFEPIRQRYSENYSTPALMGKLAFSDIDVRLLPTACGKSEIALVTGKFHLDRAVGVAPTKDDGLFSLVWRKGPQGWKIILDHTS